MNESYRMKDDVLKVLLSEEEVSRSGRENITFRADFV